MAGGRPNILLIMADQLNGTLFPDGPAAFLRTPALSRLSETGVRFANAYCPSPLCAPSRAAFMSGQLPSRTGVYDNAAEFPSSIPTFAHYLRRLGYRTTLSGKMHFVGPDQLHGFEERLTTDIYPADFGWTPDWTRPDERIDWWYHNLSSVTAAGVAEITNQLEYDDEVAHFARQRLYDFARRPSERPFCLTVSFTHPHDPYAMRRRFLDLYDEASVPTPAVPPLPYEAQDPHSRRLFDMSDWRNYEIREEDVRRSRRAYLASISYVDEKVGELLDVLDTCGLRDETIVLFTSDHGDMLGERGLWFKMSFFEGSARVPLLLSAPSLFVPRLVTEPASLLDVLPTLVELAGGDPPEACDGASLVPLASGAREEERRVAAEYAAEGAVAPMVMLREGNWKYVATRPDPPQLFDLAADPHETRNLADDPAYAAVAARFAVEVAARWDLSRFEADVLESQRRRLIVYEALRRGHYYPWDFQPLQAASERYMRNHLDLNNLEASARFPPA